MKNKLTTAIAALIVFALSSSIRAQNTFPPSGNTGIGTATPTVPLEIVTTSGGVAIKIDPFTPIAGGNPATGELRFLEKSSNGSDYVGLKAPNAIGGGNSKTYTLPALDGVSGQFLSTNGSGVMSWVSETDPQVGVIGASMVPKWNGSQLVSSMIYDNGSTVKVGEFTLILNSTFQVNGFSGDDPINIQAFGAPVLKGFNNQGVSIGSSLTAPAQGLYVFGKTGLGTNNPAVKLEVASSGEAVRLSGNDPLLQFADDGNLTGYVRAEEGHLKMGTNSDNNSGDIYFLTKGATRMFIRDNGNIGINNTNPATKLHVKGNGESIRLDGSDPLMQFYDDGVASAYVRSEDGNMKIGTNNGNPNGDFYVYLNGNNRLFIDQDGNMGLSTSDVANGYRLSVNGKVICEELKVQLAADWPDYVFHENYSLKSLSDLESFISENKHLPNVPSADEIKTSGLSVGEMQTRMMEKIEELTLYVIDLQKQNNELKERINTLAGSH